MTKQKSTQLQILTKLLPAVVFVVLGGMFFHLALHVYFADSEIWLLTLSQKAFAPGELLSIYYKWSFHAATYLFSHFAPTEVAVYEWARAGWSVIAILSVLGTARIFTRLFKNPELFWHLSIFLLTSSVFFNQGFRIRGDIFAYFLHVAYLSVYLRAFDTPKKAAPFAALLGINLLLILSTPKALIFVIAQLILGYFLANGAPARRRKDLLWLLVSSHTVIVVVGCIVALLSTMIPGAYNLVYSIASAIDFYIKSFDTSFGNTSYFSAEDMQYVFRFIANSWIHAAVLVLGFAAAIKDRKNNCGITFYALFIFFAVLAYNQKFPFFLGPFLTPVLAFCFCRTLEISKTFHQRIYPLLLVTVLLSSVTLAFLQYSENIEFNKNKYQKEAVAELEAFQKKHPKTKIYDVIGLLPRKNTIFAFVGPGEVARKNEILNQILQADPDVIIQTYKTIYLDPDFFRFLIESRVPIEPNVWVKGFAWTKTEHPDKFARTVKIENKEYWVFAISEKKFVSDLVEAKPINNETFGLDKNLKITDSDPVFLAVPSRYLALIFTDTSPIGFSNPPNVLFRYDTSF